MVLISKHVITFSAEQSIGVENKIRTSAFAKKKNKQEHQMKWEPCHASYNPDSPQFDTNISIFCLTHSQISTKQHKSSVA